MPTYTGTTGAETITGSAGDDVIDGRGGNDQLNGLGGADRFLLDFGGYGGDRPGSPLLDGGDGADRFELTAGLNVTYGRYIQGQDYWEYRTPVGFTLGAGSGGDAVFTWGYGITDSRLTPITYELNTATLRSVETIVFHFTPTLAYEPRQYGPGGNAYWDERDADRLVVSDLSGTTLTGLIDFDGGAGNDVLDTRATANAVLAHGGTQNDWLMTGSANDQLFGDAGDDRLGGGAGSNLLDGGAGSDTADYSGATQTVVVNLNDGVVVNNGYGAVDTLTGIENLTGGAFNDVLIGEASANRLEGGDGADYLIGLGGNDILDGGAGSNTLQGGLGDDTYLVRSAGDTLLEAAGEGVDTVFAHIGAYRLRDNFENLTAGGDAVFIGIGNGLANIITGGAGADTLVGEGGDDSLYGGSGAANTLVGGAGNDTYYVTATGDTLVEAAGQGHDVVMASVGYIALHANIEDLIFVGGPYSGRTGIGNASANLIRADIGPLAHYRLYGMGGDDTIEAFGGDDVIGGGQGNDTLIGGAGFDTVDYASAAGGVFVHLAGQVAVNDGDGGADVVQGFEAVIGSAYSDVLVGSAVANTLNGGAGADTLLGFAGDDILIGGTGAANTLQGGLGDDRYVVQAVGDTVYEEAGQGTDTVETGLSAFTLGAHVENLVHTGGANFTGTGNALANALAGAAGNDVLRGAGGDDVLTGGGATDIAVLSGVAADYQIAYGAGFVTVTDSIAGRDGVDTLYGIEQLRFGDGSVVTLTPPSPAPGMPFGGDKAGDLPLVLPQAGWDELF